MKVFNLVKVKETGQLGKIIILVGAPPREAYVELYPGAGADYVYFTMWEEGIDGVELRTLNHFLLDELERPTLDEKPFDYSKC